MNVPAHRRVASLITGPRHVDRTTSFYAGFPPHDAHVPFVTLCGGFGDFITSDSLSASEIRQTMKLHQAQLARCYTKVVELSGGPDGTVELHFFIDRTGAVATAESSGDLTDERITSCLTGVMQSISFRASDTAVRVNYPLRFHLER